MDGLSLRKYSLLNNKNLCLIEQISLKPLTVSDENWKINQVEFISKTVKKNQNYLFYFN